MAKQFNPRREAAPNTPNHNPSATDQPNNHPTVPIEEERATQPVRKRVRMAQLVPSEPIEVIDDDPVFSARDAATFLHISEDNLKKRRQRGQEPEFYYQYEENGAVLYALSDLMAFRASHKIRARDRSEGKRG